MKPIYYFLLTTLFLVACGSDDSEVEEMEEAMEEETIVLSQLVDSWQANQFVFLNPGSATPESDILGMGATVFLDVMSDDTFIFRITFQNPVEEIQNTGIFRVVDNELQARFDNVSNDFESLEAQINGNTLSIEGSGFFDLSGEGSNVPIGFRSRYSRL